MNDAIRHISIFLVIILFFSLIISISFAEYPKEKPLSAIGCEFLSINNESLYVTGLFNGTKIYADINYDGIWEVSYEINDGNDISLKQPNQNSFPSGSKIYSTKPIWLKQRLSYYYNYNSYTGFVKKYDYLMTLPPIANAASKYVSTQSKIYLLSDKDTTVEIDGLQKHIKKNVLFSESVLSPTKIISDVPIYAFSSTAPLNPLSNDFYSDFDAVSIIVPEDETTLYFDYDLDGNYDNFSVVNKGTHNYVFSNFGVHIWSDKEVGLSSSLSRIKDSYGIYTQYPVYPASHMSNEYFILAPINFETASFTFVHDALDDSFTKLYGIQNYQKGTNTDLNYNKVTHVLADRPFLSKEYYYKIGNLDATSLESTPFPSPDITFIQYPIQKNILIGSNVTIISRLFNTFATTNMSNISITFSMSNSFILFDLSTKIYIKDIFNDSIIEEGIKLPVITEQGNVEFFFNRLNSNTYIEIQYVAQTPDTYSAYKLSDTNISYDVPTWYQ